MKVSSGWSAVGAFFGVLIILDLLTHPTGTTAVAGGLEQRDRLDRQRSD